MSRIFYFWRRCNWCGKVSFLGLGWIENNCGDYCSGICSEHKRQGFDFDSGDRAKKGLL